MILVTGHISIDPERRDDFLAALDRLIKPTLEEPGCLKYQFSVDLNRPGRFNVEEQWETEELLNAHMAQPHFVEFGKVMQTVGVKGIKSTKHEVISSTPMFGG